MLLRVCVWGGVGGVWCVCVCVYGHMCSSENNLWDQTEMVRLSDKHLYPPNPLASPAATV